MRGFGTDYVMCKHRTTDGPHLCAETDGGVLYGSWTNVVDTMIRVVVIWSWDHQMLSYN
jgi:hypothetical protein